MDSRYKLYNIPGRHTEADPRVRLVELCPEVARALLAEGHQVRVDVVTGLPADARFFGAWVEFQTGRLMVAVRSATFATLAPDDWIPELTLTFRTPTPAEPEPTPAVPDPPAAVELPACPTCRSDETRRLRLRTGFLCGNCAWVWGTDDDV